MVRSVGRYGEFPKGELVADLHLHSTRSDGELTPEEIVDEAAKAGLGAIALTDHDTMAGVEAASIRGDACGVEVIPGCELTTYSGEVELHILAYFGSSSDESPLAGLLDEARIRRWERALEMTALLRKANISINDDDVRAFAGATESIGIPHVAKALIRAGYARSFNAAITKYLCRGCVAFVPKHRITPRDAVEVVHASGGIAILAHPGIAPHDELIASLFRDGLDGIEALHQSHSEINKKYYAGLACRYERCISGGSDFHGMGVKSDVAVGSGGVTRAMLSRLRICARRYADQVQVGGGPGRA